MHCAIMIRSNTNHLLLVFSIGIPLSTLIVHSVTGNDAEFGRIITFDNFDHFKASMNKSYGHDHMEKRARVAYEENCRRVKQHNEHAQNGKYSFEIRANHLADMSQSTYLKHFTRLTGDIHPHSERAKASQKSADHEEMLGSVHRDYDDGSVVPDSLDWRQLGYRTHPKNQMTCGSCYAFSITSAIEAQVFRRTGKVVPLSVQQIVDCSSAMGNGGCRGGSLGTTLKYLKSTKGLMRSVDYPYESEQQRCFYKSALAVVNITRGAILPHQDENAMKRAIALYGPISIAINAKQDTFQLYSHGIYDDPDCDSDSVNHAMLAVGYTPEYFILQNWWGEKWGENGYMKIRRNQNMCGLSNYAAYVVV